MANLLPTSSRQISQNYQMQSQQQAKQLLDNAKAMASDYLQSMKQMAGGQPGQPMRTMQKEQMDINNALSKVNAYSSLSGKVPEMDYLKMVGLQNTFGPIAGQKTYDAQLNDQDIAMQLAKLQASGSSGSSGGGGGVVDDASVNPYYLDSAGERANVMTGQLLEVADAQYQLNKQREEGNASKYPLYYTLNSLFNDPSWRKEIESSGADIQSVADYLITKYSGMTPDQYFVTNKVAESPVEAAYKQLISKN
jgi:hypothetical protein